jgi:hypothetical protein
MMYVRQNTIVWRERYHTIPYHKKIIERDVVLRGQGQGDHASYQKNQIVFTNPRSARLATRRDNNYSPLMTGAE